MREYRVWCKICATEFLVPERYGAAAGSGTRVPCPKCGDLNQHEYRDIKVAGHGKPKKGR